MLSSGIRILVPCMHGLRFKTTKINSKFVQKKNHKITYLLFLIQRYTVTNSDGPQVTGFWLLKKNVNHETALDRVGIIINYKMY